MTHIALRGEINEGVQDIWPGRLCDVCRNEQRPVPNPATHARDKLGGGRDFWCDEHIPREND